MARQFIQMPVCPICHTRATLLTIRRKSGRIYRAIKCANQNCGCWTGFHEASLTTVMNRWRTCRDLVVHHRAVIPNNKPREWLQMEVDT